MLFFLQAAATVVFGVEFRNLGVRLPSVVVGEMNFSMTRLIAFAVAMFVRKKVREEEKRPPR
mgnify:CR=1 FL=1